MYPRATFTALVCAIALALQTIPVREARAAAPVLPAPKAAIPGASGQTPGLQTPALPDSALPDSGSAPQKSGPGGHDAHDHDAEAKPSGVIAAVDLPKLPALVRTSTATWDNGYSAIRSAIAALNAEANRAKLEPKGRPLVIYIDSNDAGFRFDVLLPLASEPAAGLQLSSGFRTGHNPGGTALKFEHRGAYADIETTYEAITAYLDQKDMNAREFFIEEIVNDIADPGDIKTAVNIYVFLK